jgi:rhamnosyltransferase
VLNANLAMLEVLPDVDDGDEDPTSLRVGVLAHCFYDDMIDELADLADNVAGARMIVTTSDDGKRDRIAARLEERGRHDDEVRTLPSNRGRDISAFLLGLEDVLRGDEFDVIVKLHSKRSPQNGYSAGTYFKRHLYDNLLGSEGYARNLLRLFVRHESLGIVFPPMIHIGFPTMGRAWFANEDPAKALMRRLGIDVPVDDDSPLAPFGSMFAARPAALRRLLDAGLRWEDFPDEGGYADGGLAHTLERLFGYAALSEGMHVRTVMGTRHAAISHTMLEYKLNAMDAGLPGPQREQLEWVRHAQHQRVAIGALRAAVLQRPGLARVARPVYAAAKRTVRRVRGR